MGIVSHIKDIHMLKHFKNFPETDFNQSSGKLQMGLQASVATTHPIKMDLQ